MISLGLDLGSARCGLCVLTDGVPTAAATVEVESVDQAARELAEAIGESGAARVVLEWNEQAYGPRDVTPQAAAKIIQAQRIMAVLRDRVRAHCEAHGIEVRELSTAAWRARVGARKRRDDPAGAEPRTWKTADASVREALVRHLGEAMVATLPSVDQRDACGVALADHMGPTPPKRRARKLGTRWLRRGHPSDAAFDALLVAKGLG